MNKINVNMTPNPLDLQTLHCSQGDTEERKFQFTLHNQGEVFDLEDIADPVFSAFPVHVGGTEELQPVNGTSPSTSPIIADITYPDGLREGEEFTYRESPTTISGNAIISGIKGNTLVWNQLIEKGNMTDGWIFSNATGSYADNVLTFTASATNGFVRPNSPQNIIANHKYLGIIDIKGVSSFATYIYFTGDNGSHFNVNVTTNWQTVARVFTNPSTGSNWYPRIFDARQSGWDAISVRNCMLIDLTQMFGTGNEPTSVSDFTSLFPLSYYQYDSGSLLSFNGTGIKTTGKNLLPLPNAETKNGVTLRHNADGSITFTGTATSLTYFDFFPSGDFDSNFFEGCIVTLDGATTSGYFYIRVSKSDRVGLQAIYNNSTVSNNGNGLYLAYRIAQGYSFPSDGMTIKQMMRFAGADASFEPYKESVTSLPTLTYFPTGMKSAGNVYDELTPSKAITRIGAVDLGSLSWSAINGVMKATISDSKGNGECICVPYISTTATVVNAKTEDKVVALDNIDRVCVYDSAYTSASDFKTAMSGVYLNYELSTESEQSIMSASLVTESAEIPLYVSNDMLVGDCTEELSENAGYHVAKIKFTYDDGTNYSNKIEIHVERSPQ